jgi:capsid protein
MMSLFLKTTSPAINPASVDPYDLIDLQRNTMMTLPDGWDVQQLKAEQPTTTHDAFASTVLREIARCLDMPYSIAVGDSSKLNYSSGRLDHQTYHRAIGVDRVSCERSILDRLFAAWLDEALLTDGLFVGRPDGSPLRSSWDWPPFAHVDPRLEAEATQIDLANGLTSLPSELAIRGRRWEAEFARAARALGVSVPEYQTLLRQRIFAAGGSPAQTQPAPVADEQQQQPQAQEARQ